MVNVMPGMTLLDKYARSVSVGRTCSNTLTVNLDDRERVDVLWEH